ncbi:hypothetical protein DBB30_33820, partial [Yersinia pestis]
MAYYTTPLNILPVTQGNVKDFSGILGTTTGLLQVGMGFVQMIGKSVAAPVGLGANILSLFSSTVSMRNTFTGTVAG